VSEGINVGAIAQQYYKKPTSMGGGGNKFTGFTIPAKLATDSSAGVDFVPTVAAQKVTIIGTPFSNSGYTWTVTTTITDSSIKSIVQ
jgi:hypothetical protein